MLIVMVLLAVAAGAGRGTNMLKGQLMLMLKVFVVAHMLRRRRRHLLWRTLMDWRLGIGMTRRMM